MTVAAVWLTYGQFRRAHIDPRVQPRFIQLLRIGAYRLLIARETR